ncbi:DUF1275 family protein [Gordonia polyisoprenivorans]|uniref:DUF1275 family protein n=1 Tax=Gordonia polyisoprenivorans TaxID=84595 RepID=UPI000399B815|nr:YoaK family protein [Gordonia polyisoprenivorans]
MPTTELQSTVATTRAVLGPFYDFREMILAAVLAALAGATGAAAWLYSAGWYVTFMTGNTERMVLEHYRGAHQLGLTALATVVAFCSGVVVAPVTRIPLRCKARHGAPVLSATSMEAVLVWDSAITTTDQDHGAGPVLCPAFGLGALKTSISRKGEVVMPPSYVAGILVTIGRGASLHLAGVKRWGWVAHVTTYAGFLSGASIGGALFTVFGEPLRWPRSRW